MASRLRYLYRYMIRNSHKMRTHKGALERGLDILFLLGSGERALDVGTIADRLRVPKSTVYRILRALRSRGLVILAHGNEGYRLGLVFLQWANAVQKGLDIVQLAGPVLRRLAQETGETVQLMLRDGTRAVTVDVAESPAPVRVAPERGRALPLHCGAASKAILAYLPDAEWREVLGQGPLAALTRKTLRDVRRLRADLLATRARGYALSEEEVYEGAKGVAAPIFDEHGTVSGSLAISGLVHRLRDDRLRQAVSLVQREAALLSKALGFEDHRSRRRA